QRSAWHEPGSLLVHDCHHEGGLGWTEAQRIGAWHQRVCRLPRTWAHCLDYRVRCGRIRPSTPTVLPRHSSRTCRIAPVSLRSERNDRACEARIQTSPCRFDCHKRNRRYSELTAAYATGNVRVSVLEGSQPVLLQPSRARQQPK